jgi:hypothetical protein
MICIFGGLLAVHLRHPHRSVLLVTQTPPVSINKAELAQLDIEADFHQRLANRLRSQRSQAAGVGIAITAGALPDPLERLAMARARTANILVRAADRISADEPQSLLALEDYRRAAGLFPDTTGGQLAARRLSLLHSRL